MSKVWEHAPSVKGDRLIVLLALADWANDDGLCWPKMETIASKARTSKDGTSKIVKWLEENGFLTVKRGLGRSNQSHYKVHPKGDAASPFINSNNDQKGDLKSPFNEGVKDDAGSRFGELKGDPETAIPDPV